MLGKKVPVNDPSLKCPRQVLVANSYLVGIRQDILCQFFPSFKPGRLLSPFPEIYPLPPRTIDPWKPAGASMKCSVPSVRTIAARHHYKLHVGPLRAAGATLLTRFLRSQMSDTQTIETTILFLPRRPNLAFASSTLC